MAQVVLLGDFRDKRPDGLAQVSSLQESWTLTGGFWKTSVLLRNPLSASRMSTEVSAQERPADSRSPAGLPLTSFMTMAVLASFGTTTVTPACGMQGGHSSFSNYLSSRSNKNGMLAAPDLAAQQARMDT